MNMHLDLNPADFQLCNGFGFHKSYLTGFGSDSHNGKIIHRFILLLTELFLFSRTR